MKLALALIFQNPLFCRYDHIDQALMKKHGIKVGYTPGVLTNDVADLSVCLSLMTMRRVKEHVQ